MNWRKKVESLAMAAVLFGLVGSANAVIVVTPNSNATDLVNAILGTGITVSNQTLSTDTTDGVGTFTGGNSSGLGFDTGIVLTTGVTGCVPGPNDVAGCTGAGESASLSFDFTSTSGDVFFSYVFGSEEYNEFVGSNFNDRFELRLDGTNIALLPGGGGVVEINNVNNSSNSAFYRDNTAGGLNLQYDGLTTVLTASALGLAAGSHSFEFFITDVGDTILDSGVFISGGTFSDTTPPVNGQVPEPGSLGLIGVALAGLAVSRRRKQR